MSGCNLGVLLLLGNRGYAQSYIHYTQWLYTDPHMTQSKTVDSTESMMTQSKTVDSTESMMIQSPQYHPSVNRLPPSLK